MALTKLETESQAAFNIRCRLIEKHECVFEPSHVSYFFAKTFKRDPNEQTVVYFLDSLYAALQAPEKKVAFRSYVQACEYSATREFRFLRYHFETAFYEAKMRIEKFLEE